MAGTEKRQLRLVFTGDVALGPKVKAVRDEQGAGRVFRDVAHILKDTDLAIVNFEGFVAQDQNTASRQYKMAVHPSFCDELLRGGVHIACLANNHVMDGGAEGLGATLTNLRKMGVGVYGAGASRADAEVPFYFEKNGVIGAIIGACDFSPHYAGKYRPGIAPMHESSLLERVRALRESCDVVIVTLHSDLEFTRYPAPWRVAFSRALIDAGAALVVQHHPHVVQGVEKYRGGLIAYSLGNSVFAIDGNHYQERKEGVKDGILLRVDVALDDGFSYLDWRAIPHRITPDHCPAVLSEREARTEVRRFQRLCDELHDPGLLWRMWRSRARRELRAGLWNAYWKLRRRRVRDAYQELRRLFVQPELRRLWRAGFVGKR